MKIRVGFVSNSSSSSFVVRKDMITAKQRDQIFDHIKESKRLDFSFLDDPWSITENSKCIRGYTGMDNFDMHIFLEKIGVPEKAILWEDHDDWYMDEWYEEQEEKENEDS